MTFELHQGDCLEVMRQMDDNSIDTVITDPPYGLSGEPDMVEVLTHWLNGDDYDHRGGGFMGKSWDSFVPGPAVWREVYRVMKPGGALLAFGGTRTADLLSIAIRLAGFQRFDEISYHYGGLPPVVDWLYASGFPKSTDISKKLDQRAGVEREVVGISKAARPNALNHNVIARGTFKGNATITAPATDAAKLWSGWGTALKPAHEPILCFYKPRQETYAKNALAWGVAGLWIDGARVETGDDLSRVNGGTDKLSWGGTYGAGPNNAALNGTKGRWPANLILDDSPCVVDGFPVTGNGYRKNPSSQSGSNFHNNNGAGERGHNDSGSAARYFYCAKASKRERSHGLPDGMTNKHVTVKPVSLCRYIARLTKTPTGGIVLDPFCGSGSIGVGAVLEGRRYIGIDQDADSIETARYRLAEAEREAAQPEQLELIGA